MSMKRRTRQKQGKTARNKLLLLLVPVSLLLSAGITAAIWAFSDKVPVTQNGLEYDSLLWNNDAKNPLGSAVTWNGIILGDAENVSNVEGALAVSGKLTNKGNYSGGFGPAAKQDKKRLTAKDIRLLVGGDMDLGGLLTVYGNAMVAGKAKAALGTTLYALAEEENNTQYRDLLAVYDVEQQQARSVQKQSGYYTMTSTKPDAAVIAPQTAKTDVSAFFADADASLFAQHATLARLAGKGAIQHNSQDNSITLIGTNNSINVFTLDLSGLESFEKNIKFDIPEQAVAVVNIFSDDAIAFTGKTVWGEEALAGRVLFHFINALQVGVSDTMFINGSILAPQAKWNVAANAGYMRGTAVLGGLKLPAESSFALYYTVFQGFLPVVPPEAPATGHIVVAREGELFGSVKKVNNQFVPSFVKKRCAGAVFEVYASETILSENGALLVGKDTRVDVITTDEKGVAISKALPYGEYRVVECTPPAGMALSSQEEFISVTEKEISKTPAAVFTSRRHSLEVALQVSMETDSVYRVNSAQAMQKLRYGLYAAEDIVAADQTKIPKGSLVGSFGVSGKDSGAKGFLRPNVPVGSYYVKQLAADAAYVTQTTVYPVNFIGAEETAHQETIRIELNEGRNIEQLLKRATVYGPAISEQATRFYGARMGLFRANETQFSLKNALAVAVSSENGSFSMARVPMGNWIVAEIQGSKGIVISAKHYPVALTQDNQTFVLPLANMDVNGKVTVHAADAQQAGRAMPGALFALYSDGNGNGEYDEDTDTSIGILQAVSASGYTLSGLPRGSYFLKMQTPPAGYAPSDTVYPFTISAEQNEIVIQTKEGAGFVLQPELGTINIAKDSLAGLHQNSSFRVEGEQLDGAAYSEIHKADENGTVKLEGLRVGSYRITEIFQEEETWIDLSPTQTVPLRPNGILNLSFSETLTKGVLHIVQTDAYTDFKLSGCAYRVLDRSGAVVLEGETGSAGSLIEDLPVGSYFCMQTSVGEGYLLPCEVRAFTIGKGGQTIRIAAQTQPFRPSAVTPPKAQSNYEQWLYLFAIFFAICSALGLLAYLLYPRIASRMNRKQPVSLDKLLESIDPEQLPRPEQEEKPKPPRIY